MIADSPDALPCLLENSTIIGWGAAADLNEPRNGIVVLGPGVPAGPDHSIRIGVGDTYLQIVNGPGGGITRHGGSFHEVEEAVKAGIARTMDALRLVEGSRA